MSRHLKPHWQKLDLAQRFAIASLAIILGSMMVVGWWVNREIEAGVTQRTGITTALYVSSFVAPHVQELAHQDRLSPGTVGILDDLLHNTPLGARIVSIKVWGPERRIVYSGDEALIGKQFAATPRLQAAWKGTVVSSLSELAEEENARERTLGAPLLETYSPVRETGSTRVIAVVEFYELAADLQRQLKDARLRSWMVVALATLVIFGLLSGIVRQGSRTIARQRAELEARVQELSALLARNEELSQRVREASNRASELNEMFLRRISTELHDGPAQGIGYALLRFDALKDHVSGNGSDSSDLDRIRGSLQEAMQEIRNLCRGIALPELDALSLTQALRHVVRAHERRTETRVETVIGGVPEDVAPPLKIGIYRFVQEALNNAYRHGGGKRQKVTVSCEAFVIAVEVSDAGGGFVPAEGPSDIGGLGILGMRKRVESFGGSFELDSSSGEGTRVRGFFPLEVMEADPVP